MFCCYIICSSLLVIWPLLINLQSSEYQTISKRMASSSSVALNRLSNLNRHFDPLQSCLENKALLPPKTCFVCLNSISRNKFFPKVSPRNKKLYNLLLLLFIIIFLCCLLNRVLGLSRFHRRFLKLCQMGMALLRLNPLLFPTVITFLIFAHFESYYVKMHAMCIDSRLDTLSFLTLWWIGCWIVYT